MGLKQVPQVKHNPPSEIKQHANRQYYHPNSAPRDNNSSQPNTNKPFTTNPIIKTVPELPTPATTRFAKSPGISFRTMLQNSSRQPKPQKTLVQPPTYAQLPNLEAAFAAIPNENTTIVNPNIQELLKKLSNQEMNTARETYFKINPTAAKKGETARVAGMITFPPKLTFAVSEVLLDSGASTHSYISAKFAEPIFASMSELEHELYYTDIPAKTVTLANETTTMNLLGRLALALTLQDSSGSIHTKPINCYILEGI